MGSMHIHLQCLIGLECHDFAMIVADQTQTQSIIIIKHEANKVHKITNRMVMGVNGDSGDTLQFCQFITKNMDLYQLKNGYPLSLSAAAHFTRRTLADGLRNGIPFLVNLMFAGYDKENGGQLYSLDYLASMIRVPHSTHGFGGLLSQTILDNYYHRNMSEAAALNMVKLCINEVKQRLFVNLPKFQVVIVSASGTKRIMNMTAESDVATL